MMLVGVVWGAATGRMEAVTNGALDSAKEAVTLCITMLGVMSLWTGLMEIASNAGIGKTPHKKDPPLHAFSVSLSTGQSSGTGSHQCQLHRQFSRTGLGRHTCRHQGHGGAGRPGSVPSSPRPFRMPLLLIQPAANVYLSHPNISSLQLIPVNIIAYRSQYGSISPAAILAPSIIATLISTIVGILFCKIMDHKTRTKKLLP